MRCMEYVYTNQTLHPVGHWEYIGGRNDKRWHWAVDDNTLVPTNFAWQPRETIWKDENTLYRLDRYP